MVNNHYSYGERNHENIRDNYTQYGLPHRTSSSNSNYRSSCSSSSSGSGKGLVPRTFLSPYTATSRYNPIYKEESTSTNISSLTSETDQPPVGEFHIGSYLRPPPTIEISSSDIYGPQVASPGLLTVPQLPALEGIQGKLSRNFLPDAKDANSLTQPGKLGHTNEGFWQIPRANLWCTHKDGAIEGSKCPECDLKDETISNCSSENPPPTFTALDNIHPVKRRKRWCKCALTCLTTTTFCFLVLSIIAAYILYVEVVLKQKQYVPEPM